ncbi:pleckstrin homology domain-containing family O member 1 isoform X2 [Apteryx mantelli]|uniref:Pleckstrin homology domain-containing family O member 1 n=1 Tax=Apteryx mantelli TaxID=2696672 RepID=A0A8B7JLQ9_9AVES|nr:PREDICTED: pleckstrin homology domain-containing family O member 1 isoform X2 [Apteryx mantelli mantelli]
MMKKNNSAKRDGNQQSAQPEKVGWVRKFCGKGIFREIWKNRYVVLKGDQLYISEKEVKDEKNMQEMFDLSDYEKCEELRKSKSRSKKNHSKFTLAHSRQPGNTAPNLIFLAVSPEEKESWINALNSAITRAKNRILDEVSSEGWTRTPLPQQQSWVTVEEDSYLAHPTRDRAKIQHSRRPPTRGHLMAVASTSTSDGMLTLDLIQEEDASPEDHSTCEESFRVDLDKSVAHLTAGRHRSDSENVKSEKGRTGSLPRREVTSWDRSGQRNDSFDKGTMYTPQVPKKLSLSEKNKCASMEEILSRRDSSTHRAVLRRGLEAQFASAEPEQLSRIQELVALKLEKTQELLTEVKGYGEGKRKTKDSNTSTTTTSSSSSSSKSDSERILQESERLLGEASSTWSQAKRVLQEIKELRDLYKQFEQQQSDSKPKQSSQSQYRKSMM